MADLAARIAARIRREGPLSVAAFMAIALHDPDAGYYSHHNPIGDAGDFITAPEISQIFGELIGLCLAEWWQRAGRPEPVVVAELGPGRGTLMQDFLRATAVVPRLHDAMSLYLIEASPILRAAQHERLSPFEPHFIERIDALPDAPLLLVANEFLDALPVRQLVRGATGWAERLVALDGDRLVFADGPESPAATLLVPPVLRAAPPGAVVEICPAAAALAGALGERLTQHPGAALFVDYGYFPSQLGRTLAAIRRHAAASVLDDPGAVDLSAHVDFAAFAEAARAAGAAVHGPVPQFRFLEVLGIEARLARLLQEAGAARGADLASGVARLIDPAGMGTLFKAVALTSPGLPAPAGFEPLGES